MAKVPLPDRGQPLDVTYLYRIAEAVNDVADTISTATYNYTTVNTRGIGESSVKNTNAKFYATFVNIVTNENVSANSTKSWTFNFGSNFKYPPVVTATPVNAAIAGTPSSPTGSDVIITITDVTTSSVSGVARFNSSGNASVSVNVIAIGLPE